MFLSRPRIAWRPGPWRRIGGLLALAGALAAANACAGPASAPPGDPSRPFWPA